MKGVFFKEEFMKGVRLTTQQVEPATFRGHIKEGVACPKAEPGCHRGRAGRTMASGARPAKALQCIRASHGIEVQVRQSTGSQVRQSAGSQVRQSAGAGRTMASGARCAKAQGGQCRCREEKEVELQHRLCALSFTDSCQVKVRGACSAAKDGPSAEL